MLLLACVLGLSLLLIQQPDPRNTLRQADKLFAAGRYYEALQAYQSLTYDHTTPTLLLRLGISHTLRGEAVPAERALRAAMQQGLSGSDYYLALVYLGRSLADSGRTELALQTWALGEDCRSYHECAYRGPSRILQAETLLRQADYAAATAAYRQALDDRLSHAWVEVARQRLALLMAADDPQQARTFLADDTTPQRPPPAHPLLQPIVPQVAGETLAAALQFDSTTDTGRRALGQYYLEEGLYDLAEHQFALVDPHGSDALAAAAYAAYTAWRNGDTSTGLARLETLVSTHPDDLRARTLLALAYTTEDANTSNAQQIEVLEQLDPALPDTHLAWANWHMARREYVQAADLYETAVVQAPAETRGRYALLAARFHLTTSFELCERGLPLAELAYETLATDNEAATVLAAHYYHCGQFQEATETAHQAWQLAENPATAYYLGAALAAHGNPDAARAALIKAADLAPASIWRIRAEQTLAQIQTR